jgi:hypothetical protein
VNPVLFWENLVDKNTAPSYHWEQTIKEQTGKEIKTKCSAYKWENGLYRYFFRNVRNDYYFECLVYRGQYPPSVGNAFFLNAYNKIYMHVGKCIRCEKWRENIEEQFCPRCMDAVKSLEDCKSIALTEIDYELRLIKF